MNQRLAFLLGCVTALGVGSGVIVACSSDRPAGAGDYSSSSGSSPSATTTSTSPNPGTDAAPGSDAGTHGDAGDVCGTTITQQGKETPEWSRPDNVPGSFGGKITPGTYTLVALDTYIGPQTPPPGSEGAIGKKTGKAKRATLVVTATAMTFLEAAGQAGALATDSRRALTYTVKDTTKLATIGACPTGATGSLTFNAGARFVELVDGTVVERYELIF